MRTRRWELRGISDEIYCSSSSDHFIRVYYRCGEKKRGADYHIEGRALMGERAWELTLPAYFHLEIKRALHDLLTDGKPVFHEFDRDGNKRYDELRYHYDGWAAHVIASLAKEV